MMVKEDLRRNEIDFILIYEKSFNNKELIVLQVFIFHHILKNQDMMYMVSLSKMIQKI